jgi:hypothetical protein
VQWNDGTNQTVGTPGQGGPVMLSRMVVYPTNFFGANGPHTNVYFVTNVSDYWSCQASVGLTDIVGRVELILNPRPTVTLMTTNFANNLFAQTNCDIGVFYQVTNKLTGIGPWTVQWNDGTNQTVGTPGQGGPVMLSRTVVYPTNFFGANGPHTNAYYVTNVSDYWSCQASVGLTDIVGRVELILNPRPTAKLVTTNFPNYLFAQTNCDIGVSYQVTNVLTGIGPWTVQWNDGTNQTVGTPGQGGPVMLSRTVVYPTNIFGANGPHTNVYFVTNVSDYWSCQASVGLTDIVGRVELILNPRPTVTLITTNLATNLFVKADCDYAISYQVTNVLTGIGPWTVQWNDGTNQTVGTPGQAGPMLLSRAVLYPTNFFAANVPHTNVYFVTNVSDYWSCLASVGLNDIAGRVELIVSPRPTATLITTNVATNLYVQANCDVGALYQVTNSLTGIGPWTVQWNDGTNQTIGIPGQLGPTNLVRILYPTNSFAANAPYTNIYFITNVTDLSGCQANTGLTDIVGKVELIISPRPTATLVTTNFANNLFAQTNCDSGLLQQAVTNVLTGIGPWTVQWNDGTNQTVGTPGQPGPTNLVRTVLYPTGFPGANVPHTNVYFVTNVTDLSGCQANAGLTDIRGRIELVVTPRPTATLITTNVTTNLFVKTDCDYAISYQVTNVLTGIGPWTVQWNDGTNQTIGTPGQGGPMMLSRTVLYPTNFFAANGPHTNVYSVTNVIDLFGCRANAGEIQGSVQLIVNPRPTATLITTNIATNLYVQANCDIGVSYQVTNRLTGIGPWTVQWNDGTNQTIGTPGQTGPVLLSRTVLYPTNFFAANGPHTNIYVVTNVIDFASCQANAGLGDIVGRVELIVNPRPSVTLITTNVATNLFVQTDCDYAVSYQVTNVLTGIGPWTVQWNDGTNQTIGTPGQAGPMILSRTVLYPTNFFAANVPHTNVYL